MCIIQDLFRNSSLHTRGLSFNTRLSYYDIKTLSTLIVVAMFFLHFEPFLEILYVSLYSNSEIFSSLSLRM